MNTEIVTLHRICATCEVTKSELKDGVKEMFWNEFDQDILVEDEDGKYIGTVDAITGKYTAFPNTQDLRGF